MLKIITSLTLFAIGQLANAQTFETRTVPQFTKIEITDGVELIYTQKNETTLKVQATDGLGLSSVETISQDGILKVGCKGNASEPVKVFVSSPKLMSVKASKNAHFTMIQPLRANDFSASLSSNATFLGIVKATGSTYLKAKTGSVFNIRVECESLLGSFQSGAKVNLSGISKAVSIGTTDDALCNARNFVTEKVVVNAADFSNVVISATQEINVDVAGDAKVKYFGYPVKVLVNPEAVASKDHVSRKLIAKN